MKKIVYFLLLSLFLITGCSSEKSLYRNEITQIKPVYVSMETVSESYAGYPNKLYGWGLKKNVNAPPEVPGEIVKMMDTYGAIYLDSRPRTLYLTFDEGYENGYTGKILDVLKENNVKAAFFVTGPYLKKETDLIRRMFDEGHIVGNHTVRHPSMPQLESTEKVAAEITELNDICQELYGEKMTFFRPPRGEFSERTLKISQDLGYTNVFWSFAYKDWEVNNQKGTDYAYEQIKKGVHDGAVLLLHAVSKDNAEVLDRVIKELKSEGYQFKSLEEFGK